MKQGMRMALAGAVAVALAAGGGYWMGTRGAAGNAGHEAGAAPGASAAGASPKARKLLYYRNPMGLPDTSPVPKKDPMGMDYVPVYEGEDDSEPASANRVAISTEKVQKLGVRTEAASLRPIDRMVRAAGRIEPDERRVYVVAPRFEGYIERLHVNASGQAVAKGQALFEVYSPELVSAQREYLIAVQGRQALAGAAAETRSGMTQLAESSLMRLKNWDIPDQQIRALEKSGEARRTITMRAPAAGIVTEKKALQGMRFMPGEALFQITDLGSVWVLADVFEQDIGLLKRGAKARITIDAYPGKTFEGAVSYIYPMLTPETRTAQVRIELPNREQLLKPGMFAQVELPVARTGEAVSVPLSAVIDSGTRRIVLVRSSETRFEPREVKLGARGADYVEVLEGVRNGEQVVVAANFLIDAESNLKAAIGGFGSAAGPDSAAGKGGAAGAASKGGHKAEGTVDAIDAKTGMISINHGAVASLKWPAMTMEFKLANDALGKDLKPGSALAFEFVERAPGEWVITAVTPRAAAKAGAAAPAAPPHAGH